MFEMSFHPCANLDAPTHFSTAVLALFSSKKFLRFSIVSNFKHIYGTLYIYIYIN